MVLPGLGRLQRLQLAIREGASHLALRQGNGRATVALRFSVAPCNAKIRFALGNARVCLRSGNAARWYEML